MKIINEPLKDVSVNEMKDGDIAIITKWGIGVCNGPVGTIVQRYGKALIALGQNSGEAWPEGCDGVLEADQYRVRILPPGTQIEL